MTIIVRPSNNRQYKEVVDYLKIMKVKTEVYNEPSKKQVLESIERGAKEAAAFIKGKKQLREAKELLRMV